MSAATATLAVARVAACCWRKVSARRKQSPGWREGEEPRQGGASLPSLQQEGGSTVWPGEGGGEGLRALLYLGREAYSRTAGQCSSPPHLPGLLHLLCEEPAALELLLGEVPGQGH